MFLRRKFLPIILVVILPIIFYFIGYNNINDNSRVISEDPSTSISETIVADYKTKPRKGGGRNTRIRKQKRNDGKIMWRKRRGRKRVLRTQ